MKRQPIEPETRVGICCACDESSMALFKVPGLFRYRCAACFECELGYRHHLAPPAPLLAMLREAITEARR